jgi:hypothetical protein
MSEADPVLDDAFAAAIGHLVLSWAGLEVALDVSARQIMHRYGGTSLEKELPRALERKIRFLKDAFRKLPALVSERERALVCWNA